MISHALNLVPFCQTRTDPLARAARSSHSTLSTLLEGHVRHFRVRQEGKNYFFCLSMPEETRTGNKSYNPAAEPLAKEVNSGSCIFIFGKTRRSLFTRVI